MKRQPQTEKSPIDLLEEAVVVLRHAGLRLLGEYYLGTLPFILGLLYFWSDMARGFQAEKRLLTGVWLMTLLFFWMKTWQAIFASDLQARLRGGDGPPFTARRLASTALVQAILQAPGLFLLPFALAIAVPFGWVYAFFQNVSVVGGGEEGSVKKVFNEAWREALAWPMQNHNLVFILVLVGLLLVINLSALALTVPFLAKMFLGIESAITRSPQAATNSTFLAAMFALAWLCLDPLVKSLYALRCFYGGSLRTAADLRAELRHLASRHTARTVVILLLCGSAGAGTVGAAEPLPSSPTPEVERARSLRERTPPAVPAEHLDRTIEQVLQQREYAWRFPRERTRSDRDQSALSIFLESLWEVVKNILRQVGRWIEDILKWIFGRRWLRGATGGPALDWISAFKAVLVLLILAMVGLLLWAAFRLWRRYQRAETAIQAAQATPPALDLRDENVGADQLPEEGWLQLARDLWTRGELRLALRAFYLASLAHLAERNLITLARFKSNRDYERELGRRGHALPELLNIFSGNVTTFDRVWYGLHEVTVEMIAAYAANVERVRSSVLPQSEPAPGALTRV